MRVRCPARLIIFVLNLWVELQYLDSTIQFINTHLSFWSQEQKKQAETLCGPSWLSNPACDGNVILCGDFNAFPGSQVCQSIQKSLQDVQQKLDAHKPVNTWFGHFPVGRIDHIFVNQKIEVIKIEVPASRLEKMASDHLPLIAELRIPNKACRSLGREIPQSVLQKES